MLLKISNLKGWDDIKKEFAVSPGKEKFLNFCCVCVKVIFGLLLFMLTVVSAFVTCTVDESEITHYGGDNIFSHILFAVIIMGVLILCRHIRARMSGGWLERVFRDLTQGVDFCRAVIAFHFILGVFWVVSTQVQAQVDQWNCADIASRQMFDNYDFSDYMPGGYAFNYPYQSGIILIMSVIFRFFGSMNFTAFQICNVLALLLFDISIMKITEYMESPSAKKVASVMLVLFWPILFYTVFVYGNLMGLAVGTAALYFEYRYFKKRRLRDIVISSCMIGLAVMIKTNYLIFLVAMLIFLVMDFIVTFRKRTIFYAVLAIVFYVIGSTGPIALISLQSGIDVGSGVPKIAFVSMGLRESELAPGWWSDYYHENLYRDSGYNAEIASDMAKEDIMERLQTFKEHPGYAADFFYKKMVSQWCEPTFESLWISRYDKGVILSGIIDNILNRELKGWVTGFLNLYQTFIYWTALLFVIMNRTNKNIFLWLPGTAFIGGFLFHMIWEAKGQYTLSYFVLLIPYSAIVTVQVSRWVDDKICPLLKRK